MSTLINGCDYRNFGGGIATLGIDVAGMKAAGNQFVCEYLGRTENNGYLRAADVSLLAANGISIVSIYERNPTTISYFTTANANADASSAMAAAGLAGQTAGSAIYFTVDADFVSASDIGAIKQYFETINAFFLAHNSPYLIGAYGSGYELTALLNDPAANVKYTWLAQSVGWTGYFTFTAENIKQSGTTHPAWGPPGGVDGDVAYTASYGQWIGAANTGSTMVGTAGNDVLTGSSGNDTVDGGLGTDTVVYSGKFSDYRLAGGGTAGASTIADNRSSGKTDGVDNLTGVERLAFADMKVALDLGATQSAGESVLLLGAVLPGLFALSPDFRGLMGTGISLFDQGRSMQELAGLLLDIPIWDALTGHSAATHTDVARYLLTNINGVAPNAATLAAAVTALDTEPAHGQWLANLAASAAGQAHVGLAGLAQSGLAYL
jgi:hypothetical protein